VNETKVIQSGGSIYFAGIIDPKLTTYYPILPDIKPLIEVKEFDALDPNELE